MNYEPNQYRWTRNSIVLHDMDAKEPRMLMKIIGFTRSGLAKCQYVDKRRKRTIYPNDLKYLHDPHLFHINASWGRMEQRWIEQFQDEFERVRRWNSLYQPGQLVQTTSADGGFETRTTKPAIQILSGDAWVHLERGGMWLLKFVEPIVR